MYLETSQAASLSLLIPERTSHAMSRVSGTDVSESNMQRSSAVAASAAVGHDGTGPAGYYPSAIKKLSGDYRIIVMLVEFTDIKHERSRDEIHEMAFESMTAYWREVSYRQFNVVGDTTGWMTIGHPEAYYGKDTDPKDPGSDQRDAELFTDACRLAKDVDFRIYDGIMVVHAGHGQDSDAKNTSLLWASAYTLGLGATCGGKRFDRGGAVSEVVAERIGGGLNLGAFTHEFGHTIGLPDLYNIDPDAPHDFGLDYVGLWSLMAAGSWGGPKEDGSAPTGLEAWSRTKLGWLSPEPVSVELGMFVQTLSQIDDSDGTRVLQLATQDRSYYMIEVREKVGVDKHLPDSGVLITRIDESKGSGKGIVKVVDCHPETETIDDAACKADDSWQDGQNSVYVRVVARSGTGYIIAIANESVSVVQASVDVKTVLAGMTVVIDGIIYDASQLPLHFVWIVGSTHDFQVQSTVEGGYGIRYVFVRWSDGSVASSRTVTITQSVAYTAEYKVQYLLTVDSSRGDPQGTGWYDKGSLATFSVASSAPLEGILGALGGRYVFDHWSGDSSGTQATALIAMDGTKDITANWRTDITVPCLTLATIAAIVVVTIALFVKHKRPSRSRLAAPKPQETLTWCILCGNELQQGSIFCEYCGEKQPGPD